MNTKHDEMKQEARAAIIECLTDGYSGYYCDLHNDVFNTDYYIIGTCAAKQALRKYDVFDAIELVQDYEDNNFGERYTDCSDPEKIINMVYYIIGEECISEMDSNSNTFRLEWGRYADNNTNEAILLEMENVWEEIKQ